MNSKSCAYAGSFNPITNGHIDIINQALRLFGNVMIVVADNSEKKYLMNLEERLQLTKSVISDLYEMETLNRITVVSLKNSSLMDLCVDYNIPNIIRGLRAVDYEYELMLKTAYQNSISSLFNINLIYFTPNNLNNLYVSSSMIRQLYTLGNTCPSLVHPLVHEKMMKCVLSDV